MKHSSNGGCARAGPRQSTTDCFGSAKILLLCIDGKCVLVADDPDASRLDAKPAPCQQQPPGHSFSLHRPAPGLQGAPDHPGCRPPGPHIRYHAPRHLRPADAGHPGDGAPGARPAWGRCSGPREAQCAVQKSCGPGQHHRSLRNGDEVQGDVHQGSGACSQLPDAPQGAVVMSLSHPDMLAQQRDCHQLVMLFESLTRV